MTPERWIEIKELFHHAAARPTSERDVFLREACAEDDALRGEVEQLLRADGAASDFIETPVAFALGDDDAVDEKRSLIGRRLGAYRIEREIGQGGMGAVYLATRDDEQFAKQVAIKVIRAGMDVGHVLRRFKIEREILAQLDHPNIARLFDAGVTEDGVPFLVMEYVEGEYIDDYARRRHLNVRERLELFRVVCRAVAFAHNRLVVHRDIKPSNILVTPEGEPKLLDFGIAKLLAPEASAGATVTELRMMTPEYASPEQLEGKAVTVASDVYSLGVVLYELLTGHHPFRAAHTSAPDEIARLIRETEPERPSASLARDENTEDRFLTQRADATNDASRANDASRRRPTPPLFRRTNTLRSFFARVSFGDDRTLEGARKNLRGDVDNIVLMALRKEPARRYASVETLAEDIYRHLKGLPVRARPDTFSYRADKFLRRNKRAVAVAALLLVSLVGGTAATAWQWRRAEQQRRLAERRFADVRSLANSVLFKYHDAIKDLPGATPAREMLVRDALQYLDRLAEDTGGNSTSDDPALTGELAAAYSRVGDVQGKPYSPNLGDSEGALASYRKAAALYEQLLAQDSRDTRALEGLRNAYELTGSLLLRTQAGGAAGARGGGDAGEALAYQERARALAERLLNIEPSNREYRRQHARSLTMIGDAIGNTDLDRRIRVHRESARLLEELLAEDKQNVEVRRNLVSIYQRLGSGLDWAGDAAQKRDGAGSPAALDSYRASLDYHRQMLLFSEQLYAQDSTNELYRRFVAIGYQHTGDLLVKLDDPQGGLKMQLEAFKIDERIAAADPANREAQADLAIDHSVLARSYLKANDRARAHFHFEHALEIHQRLLAAEESNAERLKYTFAAITDIGDLLRDAGNRSAARTRYEQARRFAEQHHERAPTRITNQMLADAAAKLAALAP